MLIGMCGAHRSGKTTLGQKFAERNQMFKFVATSVSDMMKSIGIDPQLDYPLEVRLLVQNFILDELDRAYAQYDKNAIFDRTPLDAAAYLLADITREGVSPQQHDAIQAYLQRAFDITNRRFSLLVFVPSTLPLVADAAKAPIGKGYVEHISLLINGLKADQRMRVKHWSLARGNNDLTDRLVSVERACMNLLGAFQSEVEIRHAAGMQTH